MVKKKDRYVIKKYVMATSATAAIRLDKKTPVQGVWIDEEWKAGQRHELASCIGFTTDQDSDYDE